MSDKTDEELKPNTDPKDVTEGAKPGGDSSAASAPSAASAAKDEEEREGGMGPAILAGVGILAVVAALVFWPSDDEKGKGKDGAGGKSAAAAAQGHADGDDKGGASAKGPGGVAARNVDDPSRVGKEGEAAARNTEFKVNPAVRLPRGIGMAPGVPPEEPPPKFDTKEEEIAWWEAKLARANTQLEMRKKATERLAKWKEKAEASDNPDEQLAQYDQRAEVVNENYRKAQAKVAELEKKIAELKGD